MAIRYIHHLSRRYGSVRRHEGRADVAHDVLCGEELWPGIVELIVNWWKISGMPPEWAGIVALLVRIMHDGYPAPSIFIWLCISIIVAGAVGMCRVWLGRHTVWQVLAGYTNVGFCGVFS